MKIWKREKKEENWSPLKKYDKYSADDVSRLHSLLYRISKAIHQYASERNDTNSLKHANE